MTTVEPGRFGSGFRNLFLKARRNFLCETDESEEQSDRMEALEKISC